MSDLDRIGPRNRIRHIEIDEVSAIEELCGAIRDMPPNMQLDAVREFLNNNLLNALDPGVDIPKDVEARVWNQRTTKALSTVLNDKYGVCLDWHVVGQAILNKLGIETIFQVGEIEHGPKHTYLDVKINNKWEIFDPFAEDYLRARGYSGKQFQKGYYLNSNAYKQDDR